MAQNTFSASRKPAAATLPCLFFINAAVQKTPRLRRADSANLPLLFFGEFYGLVFPLLKNGHLFAVKRDWQT